MDIVVIAVK